MFNSLIDSSPAIRVRKIRGICTSSGSVFLHTVILSSLLTASHLHVEPLAEPASMIQFVGVVPPPPPAPPPPPSSSGASAKIEQVPRPEILPAELPDQVEPREPADALPDAAGGSDEAGVEGGVKGGIPGGVPDGVPGGVPYGVIGGVDRGVPYGVLNDLPREDKPLYITGDVRPPERTTFVKPGYPEMARKARAEGKVILEIVVGRTGDVEEVKILKSNPLFDQAAIEAVQRWKYQPALQGGRPVKVYLIVNVEFALN